MKMTHHHISMITKDLKANFHFYHDILGLRLVNKTVNQDSTDMYHLFYGDFTGAPGTELTFFEIPLAGRTIRGTNAITRMGLLVPSYDSLVYWQQRLQEFNVTHEPITKYAGYDVLAFEDSEGLRMLLINHNGQKVQEKCTYWPNSPVEEAHRILGLCPIDLTVQSPQKTIQVLQDVFSYTVIAEAEGVYRLQSEQVAYSEFIVVTQDGPSEKPGRGSIHHIAVRAGTKENLVALNDQLKALGYMTTNVVDRHYFESVYFRDGNNLLFEIATDEPGFAQVGHGDLLGTTLHLPAELEHKRSEIESKLKPLQ